MFGPEIGSLFLFEVPKPENVVGSSAPPADDGSAMKAHSLPGACSQSGLLLLSASFFMTLVPDGAPEVTLDHTGYDFWVTKLNQANGNYISSEMTKAFLTSSEYRQRFGSQ